MEAPTGSREWGLGAVALSQALQHCVGCGWPETVGLRTLQAGGVTGVGGCGTLEPGTGVCTMPENESSPSGAPQGRVHGADRGQHVF